MQIIKRLWLAVFLVALAIGILLLSDLRRINRDAKSSGNPLIALMQIASTPLLDQHVNGICAGLIKHGLLDEDKANLRLFNPQGDIPTANAIAREMVKGDYQLLVTSSTTALQTVAKVNINAKKTHVFGAVTFPQGAGVGITGKKAGEHPPYMAGIGTFQPVKEAFEIAHEMNPGIKQVGVVWNPSEQCSEACVAEARKICDKLKLKLIEATASSTSEVNDALHSLLAKNVDAVWIGGDTVANASSPLIIQKSSQAGIPVFTNDPTDAGKGALFGLGANYYTVGLLNADMIAEIVKGKSPADYAITNVVPKLFRVNHEVLVKLPKNWKLTEALRKLEQESGSK